MCWTTGRNFSFGVSVTHIEFGRSYLVKVLSHLQKAIKSLVDVHPEALATLQSYLAAVDAAVEKLQMRLVLTAFLAAVKVYSACMSHYFCD